MKLFGIVRTNRKYDINEHFGEVIHEKLEAMREENRKALLIIKEKSCTLQK